MIGLSGLAATVDSVEFADCRNRVENLRGSVAVMHRWFAVLLLGSMLSSQAAVLGCPAMHHDASVPEGNPPHQKHDRPSHHHDTSSAADPVSDSRHESDGECTMVLTCTNIALTVIDILRVGGESHLEAQSSAPVSAYANPSLKLLTPPPKSA